MSALDISLVISTFNRKDLLLDTLLRLESQTLEDFEVIVADDGSSDGTVDVVKEMSDRVRYPLCVVTHPKKGYRLAKTRNNGARVAIGKQLVFIDDDCLPNPDCLVNYHQSFNNRDILRGDILFVDKFDKPRKILTKHLASQGLWGSSFSAARELFFSIGGFDEEFVDQAGEDTDLERRLTLRGSGKTIVPGAHVYHLGIPHNGGMPNDLYTKVKVKDPSVIRNKKRGIGSECTVYY